MPLPKTKVIPSGWSAHHRPVANGTMTAKIRFTRITDGPAPWPPPETPTPVPVLWEGICRLQELKRTNNAVAAEQPVYLRDYLVTVPITGTPKFVAGERGDLGEVIECEDPQFLGRKIRVTDIQHGSLMWERDLVCVDDLTQNNPRE